MYQNAYTREENPAVLLDFLNQYPLATIVGKGASGWVAAQIPLLVQASDQGPWKLEGHLYRGADHFLAWRENPEVMVLFQGPQAYLSHRLRQDQGRAATWNFIQVQGDGKMHFLEEEATASLLARQIRHFESAQAQPGSPEDLPQEYWTKQLPHIVGIEIEWTRIRACFKLSLEESPKDFERMVRSLESSPRGADREMAEWMRKRRTLIDSQRKDQSGSQRD